MRRIDEARRSGLTRRGARLLASAIAAYKSPVNRERLVNRRNWPAGIWLLTGLAATPAAASEGWTFCVASMLGAKDVWITEVFSAGADRERLEAGLRSVLERQGAARIVAQCPLPNDDKTSVVNAQIAAEDFNRKLGAALHAVAPRDFPPRR
jgi:hypothetical protein